MYDLSCFVCVQFARGLRVAGHGSDWVGGGAGRTDHSKRDRVCSLQLAADRASVGFCVVVEA